MHRLSAIAALCFLIVAVQTRADPLADTVAKIKPSIVGIGTFQKTRSPPAVFSGTGFAVADGLHVVTNAHVLPRDLNFEGKEALIVLLAGLAGNQSRSAQVIAIDKGRDLALLRIEGPPLQPLRIGNSAAAREGQSLAFIGFPIAMSLGLFPATHRATLAALVPIVRASAGGKNLDSRNVTRLRDPYVIFQLDATAYPGNSGSPVFDPATGDVYGILNSVFIRETR